MTEDRKFNCPECKSDCVEIVHVKIDADENIDEYFACECARCGHIWKEVIKDNYE